MHRDGAGDPLDGLVNLFDVGVALAVGFLLAALSSLNLTDVLTRRGSVTVVRPGQDRAVIVRAGDRIRSLRLRPDQRVAGHGKRIGSVYRLADGRLVYVERR
jgi:hypothetical protein